MDMLRIGALVLLGRLVESCNLQQLQNLIFKTCNKNLQKWVWTKDFREKNYRNNNLLYTHQYKEYM